MNTSFFSFSNLHRLLVLSCGIALALGLSVLAFGTQAEEEEDSAFACAEAMAVQGMEVVEAYQNFLNEYMQVDVPSSDQVDNAMIYYQAVEDSLYNIYENASGLSDLEDTRSLEDATEEIIYCASVRDEYVELAYWMLQEFVLKSSGSKRTFEVVDALKAINTNLDEVLYLPFHQLFPQMFESMDNALPCYARECISK